MNKCAHTQLPSVTVDDNDHDYANCKLISMQNFDYRTVASHDFFSNKTKKKQKKGKSHRQ